MNILITGATGFIGQHLLEELAGDNLHIRIISRQQDPKFWCMNKNFRVLRANIADKRSLKDVFSNTDIVINLAAELRDSENFEPTNILGVQNIVALSRENNIKKIIHLSSVGVVGLQYSLRNIVVDENFFCDPKNEYERTKLEAEKIIIDSKIPFTILRPTNVFGDHHPRKALLGFLQRIKEQKPFPIKKDAIVNYVYVKDVAHTIRFSIQNNIENTTINIGESIHLRSFIEMAAQQMDYSCNIRYIPSIAFTAMEAIRYLRSEEIKSKFRGVSNLVKYKDDFLKKKIGYKYGLKTGIHNTAAYYFKQGLLK